MEAKDLLLDALERGRSLLHRTLNGVSLDDEHRQPRPDTNSIAWFAWHLTRVQEPLLTVGVRLVSVLSDNLQHAGQAAYLRGLFQGKGWLPY